MSQDEALFSRILAQEKGLRDLDRLLVIKTIIEYSDLLLESISYPMAVSTGILRLSQTFRDCTDESIRFHIFRTLEKAKKCFSVFYGFDELCGRLFSVLLTTDPIARAITLKIYGLFPEKLNYPHLFHRIIMHFIDSADKQEQESAISISIALAKLHDSFSPFLLNYLKEKQHLELRHCRLLLEVKANGISTSLLLVGICNREMLSGEGNLAKRSLLLRGLAKHSFAMSSLRSEFFEICIKELDKNPFTSKESSDKGEQEEGECLEENTNPHYIQFIQTILICLPCSGEFFSESGVKPHLESMKYSSSLFPFLVALSSKFGGFFHKELEKCALKEEFPLSFDSLLSLLKSFEFITEKKQLKMKLLGFMQQHASKLTFKQCLKVAYQVNLLEFENENLLKATILAACFSNWPLYRFPTKLFLCLDHDEKAFLFEQLKPTFKQIDAVYFYSLAIWHMKVQNLGFALEILNDQLIPFFSHCYLVHFFCFLREATIAIFNKDLNLLFNAFIVLEKFSVGNEQKFHAKSKQIQNDLMKFALNSRPDWNSIWDSFLCNI
jgi:hypothetical protein